VASHTLKPLSRREALRLLWPLVGIDVVLSPNWAR
jgi:hypothetical protein